MTGADDRPTWGVVLLTMGTRPAEMTRALESMLAQAGVALDVVVVGNGWEPTGLPDGVRGHHLPENLGIPDGRLRRVVAAALLRPGHGPRRRGRDEPLLRRRRLTGAPVAPPPAP